MPRLKPKSYRGFIIIEGDPTAPMDYPYRVGDYYFKSSSEAKKEIDDTWENARQAVINKIKPIKNYSEKRKEYKLKESKEIKR
jgi:hypothetical protein